MSTPVSLCGRDTCVMDCHATARGSIPCGYGENGGYGDSTL